MTLELYENIAGALMCCALGISAATGGASMVLAPAFPDFFALPTVLTVGGYLVYGGIFAALAILIAAILLQPMFVRR